MADLEAKFEKINKRMVNEFIFNHEYKRNKKNANPLLEVLINEERISHMSKALDTKTTKMHDDLTHLLYRHRDLQKQVFGESSAYKSTYDRLIKKMSTLKDM